MSTETSPLLLLMSRGTVALSQVVESGNQLQTKTLPLSVRHLPESSAGRFERQSSKFHKGGDVNQLESFMCYYSGWSSGCLHLGAQYRLSCVGLEKAFQKTWPYCRNGHHFTVQHLRFSVEESAGPALLETVSGGLLWSVKPEKMNEKSIVSTISSHFITSSRAHGAVRPMPPEYKQLLCTN